MASGEKCGEKSAEVGLHRNMDRLEVDCSVEPDMREGGRLGWPVEYCSEKSIGGLDLNGGLGTCRVSAPKSSKLFSLVSMSKGGMLGDRDLTA